MLMRSTIEHASTRLAVLADFVLSEYFIHEIRAESPLQCSFFGFLPEQRAPTSTQLAGTAEIPAVTVPTILLALAVEHQRFYAETAPDTFVYLCP